MKEITKEQQVNSVLVHGQVKNIVSHLLRHEHGCLQELVKENGVRNAWANDVAQEVSMRLFEEGFNFYAEESVKVMKLLYKHRYKLYNITGSKTGYYNKAFGRDAGKTAEVIHESVKTFMRDEKYGSRGRFASRKEIPYDPEMMDTLVPDGLVWKFGRDRIEEE